jgi:hypothetical protein
VSTHFPYLRSQLIFQVVDQSVKVALPAASWGSTYANLCIYTRGSNHLYRLRDVSSDGYPR